MGLDPDLEKLPKHLSKLKDPIFQFNKQIIDATHDLVCTYKPNIAFYEAYGIDGLAQLQKTIEYIHEQYADIPVLLDAKRGDIGSTAAKYAHAVFEYFKSDAVTINPYLGIDSVEPFLTYSDKGIFILCRTSNPGAADFQDLKVNNEALCIKVAEKVTEWDKQFGNCSLVVGATWSEQLKTIRTIAPDMFFLIPGIGTQGGDIKQTLQNGLTKDKSGLIIAVSRTIIYASSAENFSEQVKQKALDYKKEINTFR